MNLRETENQYYAITIGAIHTAIMSVAVIKEAALKVIETLTKAGYTAYFVGGCVRDELLGRPVADYDVTTSARPDQIKSLFTVTSSESEQYGIIRVFIPDITERAPGKSGSDYKRTGGYSSGEWIETTTFRAHHNFINTETHSPTLESDSLRRDFTVNAIYWDPINEKTIDLVGGQMDLQLRILRVIGDPVIRFQEDPSRILRAIRLSISCGLTLDSKIWDAIKVCKVECTPLKLNQELTKVITKGILEPWMKLMDKNCILAQSYPLFDGMNPIYYPVLARFDSTAKSSNDVNLIPLGLAALCTGANLENAIKFFASLGYSRRCLDEVHYLLTNVKIITTHQQLSGTQILEAAKHSHWKHLLLFGKIIGISDPIIAGLIKRLEDLLSSPKIFSRFLSGKDLRSMGYTPGPDFKAMLIALAQEEIKGAVTSVEEAQKWIMREYPH